MTDTDVLLTAGVEWVERHRTLADIAFRDFMRTGKWPVATNLQRELDRLNIADDVALANSEMPRLPGQGVPEFDEHFRLPLHILARMDVAEPLMLACRQIIWRMISLYRSEAADLRLSNDDSQLLQEYPQDVLRRAIDILRGSPPHPLGSGHYGTAAWSYEINGEAARSLTNVQRIDDYIAWQVDRLRPPPTPARRWRRKQVDNDRRLVHLGGGYTIAAAIISLIGAIGAVLLGVHLASGRNSSQNPPVTSSSSSRPVGSSSSVSTGLNVDQTWMTLQNLCSWRLGTNHVPLPSTHPLQLRIDDRCNNPKHEDPRTDTPTGVYNSASQLSAQVGAIPDGTLITVRCYEAGGQVIDDAVGNTSDIWLGITTPSGLIPNVDIGGGFTKQQLVSLRVGTC